MKSANPVNVDISRRDFIKKSAAVSLAAMTISKGGVFAAGSDKLRVGLVGCGARGTDAARNCVRAAKGVEIVAMGDLFKDRLDRSLADLSRDVDDKVNVTTDTSFVGWGFRNTGFSLAPRMSNLGMVRLGASTFPANQTSMFRELQVGSNFFLYHKQQADGAASDTLSTKDNHFLGSEIDIYVNWRITPDLAWALSYGVFLPGDAFSSQSHRDLFFTAVTINF